MFLSCGLSSKKFRVKFIARRIQFLNNNKIQKPTKAINKHKAKYRKKEPNENANARLKSGFTGNEITKPIADKIMPARTN